MLRLQPTAEARRGKVGSEPGRALLILVSQNVKSTKNGSGTLQDLNDGSCRRATSAVLQTNLDEVDNKNGRICFSYLLCVARNLT